MEWIKSEYSKNYFEKEWCIPSRDDKIIFEFMVLEMMQAGLSWEIILQKREAVREAFSGFVLSELIQYTVCFGSLQHKVTMSSKNFGIFLSVPPSCFCCLPPRPLTLQMYPSSFVFACVIPRENSCS